MPHCQVFKPGTGLRNKIIGALATRTDMNNMALIERHLPNKYSEWVKVRILNDGDTVHASTMVKRGQDKYNQTYVPVSACLRHYKSKSFLLFISSV